MQHSLVVEFRRRAMLARGDLVITRGLLVLGARGMGGVRHVCGFVQVAPPSPARLCDAVLMANVVIQDRRRRNPPRANVDQWGDPRMPGLPGQMFSCRRERGVVAGNRQRLRLIDGQDPALD